MASREIAKLPPRRRHRDSRFVYVRLTPGLDGHVHCARLDANGIGDTDAAGVAGGHVHGVRGTSVAAVDGHTHEIAARCEGAHSRRGAHVRQ